MNLKKIFMPVKKKVVPRIFKNGTDDIVEGSRVTYISEGGESGEGVLVYVEGFKISTDVGRLLKIGSKGSIFENTIKKIERNYIFS